MCFCLKRELLTPTSNSISVISSPVGASIFLDDGTYEGETPKVLK
jgi:hypothetical protein